jgi:phenylpropionate dioxygenase-like ring-hydroxylating dioxygenase large terminal subunit
MNNTIMTDAFFASFDSSALDISRADTLPPQCYNDPEFFEFEKDAIFYRAWLVVGRVGWLKEPGDYYTTSHVDEPILVVKDREGAIRAFSPVCRHRAALVAEGKGNARSFRCPYHHWTYSLEGRLLGAPAMDRTCDFNTKDINLPEFKVEIWLGFIFVNFDPDAEPLAPRLTALSEVLANYDLNSAEERRMEGEPRKEPWNWKVRFENSNDGYHANRLHGGPVHDICPSDLASFPVLPAQTAGYFRYNQNTHADASFNPTLKALLPIFPKLTPEERHRMLFLCVPPTLTMFARCDMIAYSMFSVDGVSEMTARQGWLATPGASKDPLYELKITTNINTSLPIFAQDRAVDLSVEKGLRSRFACRGRYSWQEGGQIELNKWLVDHYQAAWNKRKGNGLG